MASPAVARNTSERSRCADRRRTAARKCYVTPCCSLRVDDDVPFTSTGFRPALRGRTQRRRRRRGTSQPRIEKLRQWLNGSRSASAAGASPRRISIAASTALCSRDGTNLATTDSTRLERSQLDDNSRIERWQPLHAGGPRRSSGQILGRRRLPRTGNNSDAGWPTAPL